MRACASVKCVCACVCVCYVRARVAYARVCPRVCVCVCVPARAGVCCVCGVCVCCACVRACVRAFVWRTADDVDGASATFCAVSPTVWDSKEEAMPEQTARGKLQEMSSGRRGSRSSAAAARVSVAGVRAGPISSFSVLRAAGAHAGEHERHRRAESAGRSPSHSIAHRQPRSGRRGSESGTHTHWQHARVCACAGTRVCVFARARVCVFVSMRPCVCTPEVPASHTHIHTRTRPHTHMHMHMHTHARTSTHAHTYARTCTRAHSTER